MSLFEIAYHLRMPVYELMNDMTYIELLGWYNYFERRPVEWRADDRAAKLLQAQGVKEKPQSLFASLAAIYEEGKTRDKSATASLKGSALFKKLQSAKGGVTIPL